MNNKFIYQIFLFSFICFLALGFFTYSSFKNISGNYESEMFKKQSYTLKSLTPQIRHLVLSGNLREATQILINWKEAGLYNDFKISNDLIIEESTPNKVIIPIYYSENGAMWGYLTFIVSNKEITEFTDKMLFQLIKSSSLSLLLLFFISNLMIITIWKTSSTLITTLQNYLGNNNNSQNSAFANLIWSPLLLKMKEVTFLSMELNEKRLTVNISETLIKISRQVSHDIRSPLAALNVALEDISSLPEKNRLILKMAIQRIQDIANNLLKNSQVNDSPKTVSTLLYPILDEILSEKRIQYKSQSNLSISGSIKMQSHLFVEINPSLLKQIISNLINNSVEAMDKAQGLIELKLYQEGGQAIIDITDNGKGIPEKIINDLGVKNISHGKQSSPTSGFGIGVKHAYDTIKLLNGTITVLSQVGAGTTFKISLPIAKTPNWFLNEIRLNLNNVILILDDDQEIHQVWDKKFEQFPLKRHHFFNSNKLREWIQNNPDSDFILLSDYELIGESATGLELIEQLGIQNRSILATSHYQDIVNQKSTIKVIPKSLVFDLNLVLVQL